MLLVVDGIDYFFCHVPRLHIPSLFINYPNCEGKITNIILKTIIFAVAFNMFCEMIGTSETPTAEEFKTWYCPLIEKMLLEYPVHQSSK